MSTGVKRESTHHTVSVVLRLEESIRLATIAKEKDCSMTHIVRRALRLYYMLEARSQDGDRFSFESKDGSIKELLVL